MSKFLKVFTKGVVGSNDLLKDWRHASHTFIDGDLRLSPKQTFLYHVAFDFGPVAALRLKNTSKLELGLMVKKVSLPSFSPELKILNAYNRKDIVNTKMKYSSIRISLHDDGDNTVYNMWQEYFKYYYRDADYSEEIYKTPHLIDERQKRKWGYESIIGESEQNRLPPFFDFIRLYSLNRKMFTEYTLVTPFIKNCSFGEHDASNGAGVMSVDLEIEYSTVLYRTGTVRSGNVKGFAELHYDSVPSPLVGIMGGKPNIIGEGGLLDTIGGIADMARSGNIFGAIFSGAKAINKFKGKNLGKMLVSEIAQAGMDVLRKPVNPRAGLDIPAPDSISSKVRGIIQEPISTVKKAVSSGIYSITGSNKVKSNGEKI